MKHITRPLLGLSILCAYCKGAHPETAKNIITGKLYSSQKNISKHIELKLGKDQIKIPLVRVTGLLSPDFSIVVREEAKITINDTSPFPVCLFRGEGSHGGRELHLAVSLCGEASGTLVLDQENYIIKFTDREKRQVEMDNNDDAEELEIIVEELHSGVCGLNKKNKKKMMVSERPIVRLKRQERRSKRSTKERVIEVAVFVDDEMYKNSEQLTKDGEDPLERIQDIVFTYVNAVQLIYQSKKLSNQLRMVLVRVDIMKTRNTDLNNHGGDIESYLESFCRFAVNIKAETFSKLYFKSFVSMKLNKSKINHNYSNKA